MYFKLIDMKNYKVILKKNKPSDSIGTLQLQYFNGKGVKKQVSLSIKITEENYKKYYDDEFKQFRKNNSFDYKSYNSTILLKSNNLDKTFSKPNENLFIEFLKMRENKINNLNTRSGLTTTRKHLTSFIDEKGLSDIEINKIDLEFLMEFKIFLSKKNITGSTMLYYFILIKGELNNLSYEGKYNNNLKYLFKKLNLKKINKHKNTLSNEDIKKLLSVSKNYKYYNYVLIGLLQLFCLGLRQSDIFLIKYGDFKNDGIIISTKKNKKHLKVPFENYQLLITLCNYFNIKLEDKYFYNNNINPIIFSKTTTPITEWNVSNKENKLKKIWDSIIEYTKNKSKNDFIFKDIINIPELENYSKNTEMNDIQIQKWKSFCVKYNYRLKMIQKDLGLEIDNLSSHTFRYTYTKLLLENGVGIHEISQVLSHSNISITENYINRNFDTQKIKEMNDKVFSQFN